MWRYRIFRVFQRLRRDKGVLCVQRPVSFSSFGYPPSFSGSIHRPNQLLDRTCPCCPAPYPFLLLPHITSAHFRISPAHFASRTPRPYIRFEALVHAVILRLSSPSHAQLVTRYPHFRLSPLFRPIFTIFFISPHPVNVFPSPWARSDRIFSLFPSVRSDSRYTHACPHHPHFSHFPRVFTIFFISHSALHQS